MSPFEMIASLLDWLEALPPSFLFLLALPFLVAIVALTVEAVHARRTTRQRVEARAVEPADAAAGGSTTIDARTAAHAMSRILIPVDGSENALRAVRHVINRSFSHSAVEAHLLHVRPAFWTNLAGISGKQVRDAHHREIADKALAGACGLLRRHGVPYAVHLDAGGRADTINRTAQRLRVDRIVIGTARRNSLTRIIEDSITSRLLEIARVPVDVISGGGISKLEKYGVPAGIGTAIAALSVAIAD